MVTLPARFILVEEAIRLYVIADADVISAEYTVWPIFTKAHTASPSTALYLGTRSFTWCIVSVRARHVRIYQDFNGQMEVIKIVVTVTIAFKN